MHSDGPALPQPTSSVDVVVDQSSLDSDVRLIIRGYGPYLDCNGLHISTDQGNFKCKFLRRPYYANWFHALDELIVEDASYINSTSIQKFLRRVKRSISIGISRRNHIAGILSGFKATADVPANVTFLKLRVDAQRVLYVSRTASKSGLVVSDFSKEMERSVRRGARKTDFYITQVLSTRPNYSGEPYLNSFQNLMPGIKAIEIDNLEFEKPTNFHQFPIAINRYLRLLNASVTPQGVISNRTPDGSVQIINPVISDYWPSSIWKSPYSQEFLSPTVSGSIHIEEPASYMGCSGNWAHFVEDNLPSILGLIHQDKLRPIYISGSISDVQKEALSELFPESSFVEMNVDYKYEFYDLLINIHQDSRNAKIQGVESNLEMVDFENLKTIRSLATSKVVDESPEEIKLFISRKGGFRPLINKDRVESIFRNNGFLIISAESLGFLERIKLFQRATVVAGETGAGLVNLYFCKAGTKVLELRHPENTNSQEQLALLKLTDHNYQIIQGRTVGAMKKLRFGVDSFYIDESEVSNALI